MYILSTVFRLRDQALAPVEGGPCTNDNSMPTAGGDVGTVGSLCDVYVTGVDDPDPDKAELIVEKSLGRFGSGMQTGEWACWYLKGRSGKHIILQVLSPLLCSVARVRPVAAGTVPALCSEYDVHGSSTLGLCESRLKGLFQLSLDLGWSPPSVLQSLEGACRAICQ